MKTNAFSVWLIATLFLGVCSEAALTTNSWFLFSGKWEDGSKWSAGVPSLANAVNTITNDLSSINVTVDGTTVLSNNLNNCMTVSNLVVGRGSVITFTLFLNNTLGTAGNNVMTILNSFTLNATGSLSISNSVLRVPSTTGGLFDNGAVWLNTGTLACTNLSVGRTGT